MVGILTGLAYNGGMRSIGVLAFLVAASMSSASFDLVMVADNIGSFNGPVPAKIHRYDGDSGVYLGSFNAGFSAINDLAVNKDAGELYALSIGRLNVFDYNTGSLKRSFTTGGAAAKFFNGKLYRASGSNLSEVNLATGATTSVVSWVNSINDFAFTGNGSYALFNASVGVLQGYSSAGVAGTPLTATGFATSDPRLSMEGGSMTNFYVAGPSTTSATTTSFRHLSLSASGNLTLLASATFSTTFITTFEDVHEAHAGTWLYGKNSTGVNSLYRMYSSWPSGGDTVFATPQVTTAGPIAVVLAPEPGTMIALGAGALALLRRRKKS